MKFAVVFTESAEEDLLRLEDHAWDHAETVDDLRAAARRLTALRDEVHALEESALRCRKTGRVGHPLERELVSLRTGYLVRFDLDGPVVVITGVRHQREGDYH